MAFGGPEGTVAVGQMKVGVHVVESVLDLAGGGIEPDDLSLADVPAHPDRAPADGHTLGKAGPAADVVVEAEAINGSTQVDVHLHQVVARADPEGVPPHGERCEGFGLEDPSTGRAGGFTCRRMRPVFGSIST